MRPPRRGGHLSRGRRGGRRLGRPGPRDPAALVLQDDPGAAAGRERRGGCGRAERAGTWRWPAPRTAARRFTPSWRRAGCPRSASAKRDLRCGPQVPDDEAARHSLVAGHRRARPDPQQLLGQAFRHADAVPAPARRAGVRRTRSTRCSRRSAPRRPMSAREEVTRLRRRRLLGAELRRHAAGARDRDGRLCAGQRGVLRRPRHRGGAAARCDDRASGARRRRGPRTARA